MSKNTKFTCCNCGEHYTPSSQELESFEEGYITNPGGVCDECYELLNMEPSIEYESHSDADPGL